MKTNMKIKKPAIDLTDLALGIVVLGIIVSIGANILIGVRDTSLTDSTLVTTANETVNASSSGNDLATTWFSSVTSVTNTTGGETILSTGNYTASVDGFGVGTLTWDGSSPYLNENVNATYQSYDTANNPAWSLADDASVGIAEYGDWFDIIVIVGIAAVIIALIFMAFGRSGSSSLGGSY